MFCWRPAFAANPVAVSRPCHAVLATALKVETNVALAIGPEAVVVAIVDAGGTAGECLTLLDAGGSSSKCCSRSREEES